jgi:hypothetical protein
VAYAEQMKHEKFQSTSFSTILDGTFVEDFYGTQYDYILVPEKNSYVKIRRLRFFYTIETLISSIGSIGSIRVIWEKSFHYMVSRLMQRPKSVATYQK